jgi:hypothetical protein
MRGWYAFGPALSSGLAVNYWCHRRGLPTVCADTRRLPAPLVATALLGGSVVLFRHLYPQENR